jgi:D-hexose-6-phosphate mutarotase
VPQVRNVTGDTTLLNRDWGQAGRVVFSESRLGGPVVTLSGAAGQANVALQGAQLLGWTPTGHKPAVWLSPVERLGTSNPVRGGTPVCWPWFGAHPTDPALPAHGFVRTRIWSVMGSGLSDAGAWIELGCVTNAADSAIWPHVAGASLRVELDDQLAVTLQTTNTGATAFTLSQALHTYFQIGDIGAISVDGFDGETYHDKVPGQEASRQQHGSITFPGEVDRIYDQHQRESVIIDPQLQRRITIRQTGSQSSVVWNPGPAKAARLGDMGPGDRGQGGWREFVCVETTNAGADVVQLTPGKSHTLTATYSVTRIQV